MLALRVQRRHGLQGAKITLLAMLFGDATNVLGYQCEQLRANRVASKESNMPTVPNAMSATSC